MFVPVTFEMAVLGGALAAVLRRCCSAAACRACAIRSSTRRDFDLATRNRFFLCLRSDDPGFDAERRRALLDELKPLRAHGGAAHEALRCAARCAARLSLSLAGCEREMHDMYEQPRYDPDEPSPLFADGRSARPPPPGSVPGSDGRPRRHQQRPARPAGDRGARSRGRRQQSPRRSRRALLQRGRERFDIYCLPCHSPVGDGDGPVVRRGFPHPPSYHEQRLRDAPDRHFYDVITQRLRRHVFVRRPGRTRRTAGPIVAYIRALQLSQHAQLAELPAALRERLSAAPAAAASSPASGAAR